MVDCGHSSDFCKPRSCFLMLVIVWSRPAYSSIIFDLLELAINILTTAYAVLSASQSSCLLHAYAIGILNCVDAALVPLHTRPTARMRLSSYKKCFRVALIVSNGRNKAQLTLVLLPQYQFLALDENISVIPISTTSRFYLRVRLGSVVGIALVFYARGCEFDSCPAGQVPPGASSMAAVVRNGSSYSFSRRRTAPIEIHRQLCQVYGPNIMSKQMMRRWCRQFSEGRQSVHDEERSGRPSLINDDRVELVRQCIMKNRRFTITELSSHFPQISRSLLHEIVTKHLLFKKVCASDFHVFLHLKKFLSSGERFGNDEELKTSVTRWFHSQAAELYDRGIQKLIPRYDKCLNSDGGYVEK
ncbi:hypothetical protein ANN_10410 [Periplaneta americana]|uniref:Mos1 transposase HTH domain-containing protein n=1 Tax=Periplaneta americana TaxID=6978 RepID=A0ABQ8TPA4_PERAM|nr:hypothetical protein ANN_10410 [Periplaneta americana]